MVDYKIVEAQFSDISKLCGSLRYDDWAEITCFGISPFKAIKGSFKTSHFRRSVFVENEIAAMWGLSGVMLSGSGEPWLLTSKAIEKIPVSFVKEGRKEINKMLTVCRRLEGLTSNSYSRAHRFLEVLGFTLDDPFEVKKVMVRRFWMET